MFLSIVNSINSGVPLDSIAAQGGKQENTMTVFFF